MQIDSVAIWKICANLTMVSNVHVSISSSIFFFKFSLISSSINHKLSAILYDKISIKFRGKQFGLNFDEVSFKFSYHYNFSRYL